jgi:hypothetical protein
MGVFPVYPQSAAKECASKHCTYHFKGTKLSSTPPFKDITLIHQVNKLTKVKHKLIFIKRL